MRASLAVAMLIFILLVIPSFHAKKEERNVLVVGFGPYGKHEINPSQLIVENLSNKLIEGRIVVTRILPVDWSSSYNLTIEAIETYKPDVVIAVGLHPRASKIRIERVAINLKWKKTAPFIETISKGKPLLRFSNLPVGQIVARLRENNISSRESYFAGLYVCNYLFYKLLEYKSEKRIDTRIGFIHVPPLKRMSLEEMIRAVEIAINVSLRARFQSTL